MLVSTVTCVKGRSEMRQFTTTRVEVGSMSSLCLCCVACNIFMGLTLKLLGHFFFLKVL